MSAWRPAYVLPLRMHLRMTTVRIVSISRRRRISRRKRRSERSSRNRNERVARRHKISSRRGKKVEHV